MVQFYLVWKHSFTPSPALELSQFCSSSLPSRDCSLDSFFRAIVYYSPPVTWCSSKFSDSMDNQLIFISLHCLFLPQPLPAIVSDLNSGIKSAVNYFKKKTRGSLRKNISTKPKHSMLSTAQSRSYSHGLCRLFARLRQLLPAQAICITAHLLHTTLSAGSCGRRCLSISDITPASF